MLIRTISQSVDGAGVPPGVGKDSARTLHGVLREYPSAPCSMLQHTTGAHGTPPNAAYVMAILGSAVGSRSIRRTSHDDHLA